MAAKDDDRKTTDKNEKAEVTADEKAKPVAVAPDADKAEDAPEEGDDHQDSFAPASGDLIMSKEDEGE